MLDIGKRGEEHAVQFLQKRGWEILDRNWECKLGELDVVAMQEIAWGSSTVPLLAFVEVKSAASASDMPPELHVTAPKRRKLVNLARLYMLREHKRKTVARFDVIAVELEPLVIRYYPDAFDALGRVR